MDFPKLDLRMLLSYPTGSKRRQIGIKGSKPFIDLSLMSSAQWLNCIQQLEK